MLTQQDEERVKKLLEVLHQRDEELKKEVDSLKEYVKVLEKKVLDLVKPTPKTQALPKASKETMEVLTKAAQEKTEDKT